MACKTHGWRSAVCPECTYHNSSTDHAAAQSLEKAVEIICATRAQKHILKMVSRDVDFGTPYALAMARGWQLPKEQ